MYLACCTHLSTCCIHLFGFLHSSVRLVASICLACCVQVVVGVPVGVVVVSTDGCVHVSGIVIGQVVREFMHVCTYVQVRELPPEDVSSLLRLLAARLQTVQPGRKSMLSWLQHTLMLHAGYIASAPGGLSGAGLHRFPHLEVLGVGWTHIFFHARWFKVYVMDLYHGFTSFPLLGIWGFIAPAPGGEGVMSAACTRRRGCDVSGLHQVYRV